MPFGDLSLDAPHKEDKGIEGGSCNVTSCQAPNAIWFNHGSHAWYCSECRDWIEKDPVNSANWEYRHYPQCGHPMFETREMMDDRKPPCDITEEDFLTTFSGMKPDYDGYYIEPYRKPRLEDIPHKAREDFPSRQAYRAYQRGKSR